MAGPGGVAVAVAVAVERAVGEAAVVGLGGVAVDGVIGALVALEVGSVERGAVAVGSVEPGAEVGWVVADAGVATTCVEVGAEVGLGPWASAIGMPRPMSYALVNEAGPIWATKKSKARAREQTAREELRTRFPSGRRLAALLRPARPVDDRYVISRGFDEALRGRLYAI